MGRLRFDEKKIIQAEEDFKKVNLNSFQEGMIENSAKLCARHLPISELALKGYINFVMRDYQIQYKREISTFLEWGEKDQVEALWQMSQILEKYLTKILIKEDQIPLLKETLKIVGEQAVEQFKLNK